MIFTFSWQINRTAVYLLRITEGEPADDTFAAAGDWMFRLPVSS